MCVCMCVLCAYVYVLCVCVLCAYVYVLCVKPAAMRPSAKLNAIIGKDF